MDRIAAFRRAIRLGQFHVRKPADLTKEMRVAMALENDRKSARGILQECYRLLGIPSGTDAEQHPIVRFFGDFDYGRRVTSDVDGRSILEEGKRFVMERTDKLGHAYATYLAACFDTALDHHETFVIDPDGNCPERPDWLGQAFHVTPYKEDGQPIDLELDADMLDAMHFIYKALQERSGHGGTALEQQVQRFIDREISELPFCIERLIVLKGYPQATEYLPAIRVKLASFILGEIERLRGTDHWRHFVIGNIVLRCGDACVAQVELLLSRTDISDEDRLRLLERRATLRDYSSESLQENNESGNAAGKARLYRKHKDKIHDQIKRSPNVRTREETARFLAEIDGDQASAAARKHPVIREAVQIINSPDVGNASRKRLLKLQKGTPPEIAHLWPDLWKEFEEALRRVAANMRKD
jgi:hypothetical protein